MKLVKVFSMKRTDVSRKRWLQARLSGLALDALNQGLYTGEKIM